MRFGQRILLILTVALFSLPYLTYARGLSAGEYFFDSDPGQGLATPISTVSGSFSQMVETILQTNINLPAIGVHTFNVRVKDDNGNWGPVFSVAINVQSASTSLRQINVATAEYFFDTDPGQGNGSVMLAFDGAFDQAVEAITQSGINLPAVGTHTFNVRAKDVAGNWGPVFSTVLSVQASTTTLRPISVATAEYFFDTDPGQGNGSVMLAFDGAFDQAVEVITQSGINLPAVGAHTFNVRAKDVAGTWGPLFSTVVAVQPSSTSLRPINVATAEYFFDTDPGQGNGSVMLAFDGAFDQAVEAITQSGINLPAVGSHTFNVRAKDVAGNWGPLFTVVLNVNTSTTSLRPISVSAGEYFFDTDPGQGNGTAMFALDGNFNSAIEQIIGGNIPTPVAAGVHVLNMRAKDVAGNWGPVFGIVVNMDTSIASFNTHISGTTTTCTNHLSGLVYSTPLTSGNLYTWAITGGNITTGSGTNSVTVTWNATGPYKLKVTECASGGSPCSSDSIVPTINTVPTSSISQTICQGQSYGGHSVAGTYTDTLASAAANGCDSIRTVVLSVNSTVTPSVSITSNPSGAVCTGTSITFTANPTNGGALPTYQWYVNGSQVGTGATYTSSSLNNNDSVKVIMTSNAICPSPATVSATIAAAIIARPVPSVTFSYNPNGISCQGTNITFTATPTNGGSNPSYQWYINGSPYATGVSFSDSLLHNGDQVYVRLISSAACATPDTVVSSTVTMNLTSLVVPSVSIIANPSGAVCQNTSVQFTANPTNGGSSPSYKWYVNSLQVGTGVTYTSSSLNNNDTVKVSLTSNAACPSLVTVNATPIIMQVTQNSAPSVTVTANPAGAICSGTQVTFTASASNGGINPTYQWYVNGIAAGSGATLIRNNLNNNDSIKVVLTSNSACASPSTATSSTIHMSVSSNITPSVNITANPSGVVCAGTSITFTANPSGGGSIPAYSWTLNGTIVSTSATYTSSSLANGDAIALTMTSSSTCASPTLATASTSANITPLVTPTVSIAASPSGGICAGTNVTFTPTAIYGGSSPTYQWKVNGSIVSSANTFSSSSLNNNDSVTLVLTSNATCASTTMVTSNKLFMAVTAQVTPSVSITANPAGQVCPNTSVTFTASSTNGGTSPSYQWYVNGVTAGTGLTLTRSNLVTGDSVYCVLTGNAPCATTSTVTSNALHMNVSSSVVPSVGITASPNGSICAGTQVTYSANPSGGGNAPTYVWTKNGIAAGSGSSISLNNLQNGDSVSVTMTSNSTCAATLTASSLTVASVKPVPHATVNKTICAGQSYAGHSSNGTFIDTFSLSAANGCDSIRTLNLTILQLPRDTIHQTICAGQSYLGHNSTGTYNDTLFGSGANGCDSIRTLILQVQPYNTFSINQTICSGTSYGGHTTSGTFVDTIHTTIGCDSIRTLILNVLPQINFNRNISICQGDAYFVGGGNQTNAGTYYDTLHAGNGCDSIITTVLTTKPAPIAPNITQHQDTLSIDTAGIAAYQWYNGNTSIIGANSHVYVATSIGNYHAIITGANGCTATSDSISIVHVGIGEVDVLSDITLLPNPTDDRLVVLLPNLGSGQNVTIEVTNMFGERVLPIITSGNRSVALRLQPLVQAIYLVHVTNASKHWVGKVVKVN